MLSGTQLNLSVSASCTLALRGHLVLRKHARPSQTHTGHFKASNKTRSKCFHAVLYNVCEYSYASPHKSELQLTTVAMRAIQVDKSLG